jgi:cysteine synthase
MARRFKNILETVGNTPVVKINRLAPPDVNLYVKIEAFNPLGSVKDRLALGIIEEAERSGQLKPGQTVIEATSGNTGIGLAMVCAQKGYPLVITMAETFSVERRRLMRFLGAKVVLTPAAQRGMGMVAFCRVGPSQQRCCAGAGGAGRRPCARPRQPDRRAHGARRPA